MPPRVRTWQCADPEEILKQQQEIRVQMQGGEGKRDEYSTYEEDLAHLQARFKHVDVRLLPEAFPKFALQNGPQDSQSSSYQALGLAFSTYTMHQNNASALNNIRHC